MVSLKHDSVHHIVVLGKKTERYIYTYACKVLAQKAMFILVSNVLQDYTALLLLFSAQ